MTIGLERIWFWVTKSFGTYQTKRYVLKYCCVYKHMMVLILATYLCWIFLTSSWIGKILILCKQFWDSFIKTKLYSTEHLDFMDFVVYFPVVTHKQVLVSLSQRSVPDLAHSSFLKKLVVENVDVLTQMRTSFDKPDQMAALFKRLSCE